MFGAVIANSQRAPYTLKAESAEEAREWAQAIEMHAPRILQMRGAVTESAGEEGAAVRGKKAKAGTGSGSTATSAASTPHTNEKDKKMKEAKEGKKKVKIILKEQLCHGLILEGL